MLQGLSGGNEMKVCVVGSTGHVGYVFEGLGQMPEVDIIAAAPGSKGENIESLCSTISRYGYAINRYGDYIRMLDMEKPNIVVVACYFGDHAKVSVEALKRDMHVFSEKPLATTYEDLDKLKQAYKNSNALIGGMFGLRYTPCFLTAKKVVEEGAIGEIRLMNAQKSYKLGNRGENYKNHKSYGGTIPWVGIHAIDWLYWFSGKKFLSVSASHSSMYNRGHGELEVSALCHFVMQDEIFGSVSIDYLRPSQAPTHADDRIRIVGTRGIIEVMNDRVFLINDEPREQPEMNMVSGKSVFADFINYIKGQSSLISAEDAFIVTEACLKARESADRNSIVFFK
jgi:predicted dehydrogenase